MNKVIIRGRIVKDLDLRTTTKGTAVATGCLAVNEYITGEGKAHFFDLVFWGETAERAAKKLPKGTAVLIEGSLSTRTYEVEGKNRKVTEIVVQRFETFAKADTAVELSADEPLPF